MFSRLSLLALAAVFFIPVSASAQESFVGHFAEPADGGNIDTARSTFDGVNVTIVPRAHASEAVSGATRWRNVWFAVRGMKGKAPAFRLPLTSPGSGKVILSGDLVSFQNIKLVWSYEPKPRTWNRFETYTRTGTGASTWTVAGRNSQPFTEDVVYVSINERSAVGDFYEWLESTVFTHSLVRPTPSEVTPGSFVIGYQSGAPASASTSRAIPDMPLFGMVIKDPNANPTKLVVLVSGQHPYEGQSKVALRAALEWILNSDTPEAKAYRSQFVTVVYPFVNPTGELAGLWRGTAYAPYKDTNRNWNTWETVPSRNRGIDTVIAHKNAMKADIAALGLGEPYALFDYHQNFGDRATMPDYLLHSTMSTAADAPAARRAYLTDFAPYFKRLNALVTMGDAPSDPTTPETLRGYMVGRGVKMPLTFERSVYNRLEDEVAFGIASVKALIDPTTIVVAPEPVPEPAPELDAPILVPEPAPKMIYVQDNFTGGTNLSRRIPDGQAPAGAAWHVHTGVLTIMSYGSAASNITSYASIETGAADAEISASVNIGTNQTGVFLRGTSSSNHLRFVISKSGWWLQQSSSGRITTLRSGRAVYDTTVPHKVTAILQGSTIKLAVDDVPVGSASVTFNQTATRHGVLAYGSGARKWHDFLVRQP